MTPGVVATVFVLVAAAELPDKTMIATLVMGSRSRPLYVWTGAAAAFLVHVVVAVAAGRAIELLPHKALEIVVTGLFFVGAVLLLVIPEIREERAGEKEAERAEPTPSDAWKVMATAFGVILVGEFGDLTQILIVNLVAKYHQPWAVGVGGYAGLLAAPAVWRCSGSPHTGSTGWSREPVRATTGCSRGNRAACTRGNNVRRPRPARCEDARAGAARASDQRVHARRRGNRPLPCCARSRTRRDPTRHPRRDRGASSGLRRDRRLVRQVDPLPRRRGRGDRVDPLQRRPPPRVRGEPGRLGASRCGPRRPP